MSAHRWAWLEIDLGAIRSNVLAFRSLVGAQTQVMAIVKADAYGHGAVRVSRAALEAGATWLGVATVDEALELRRADITAPILILAEPPEDALPEIIEHNITPTATGLEFLRTLSGHALLANTTVPFHLKIDTGMNRIGVSVDQAAAVLRDAQALPNLRVGGVFTHFATADVAGDWDVKQQIERFERALRRIREVGVDSGIVHACNSAGAVLLPEARYGMVRIGISLYGLHPSDATRQHITLTPVMSVHARATRVKPVALGEGVGYGLTWHAFRKAQLVTLPLGYADGIPRLASNKMNVLIGATGKRIEQVGTVCMDQLMCAAGPHDQVAFGDEFVLVGCAGKVSDVAAAASTVRVQNSPRTPGFISIDELADLAQTINHEITCGLGQRLEHVYRDV